jgi:hypothetical protein
MPDALLAVLAFIGGAVTTALISAATAEYRARQDHKRAREVDRGSRDRQAAAAILEEIDRLMEKFSTWRKGRVEQSEIEPYYRVMRRRAIELGDPKVRALANEISDGYFFVVGNAEIVHEDDRKLAGVLQRAAHEVLGAVVRGEDVPEPSGLARVRAVSAAIEREFRGALEDEAETSETS